MECQYCKNTFSTKTSLNNHQKSASYCLKLRGDVVKYKYKCESCSMTFHKIFNLNRHVETCKSNDTVYQYMKTIKDLTDEIREKDIIISQQNEHKDQMIKDQKHTIKELQDRLENVAIKAVQRPTTKNTQINNYIQNLKPLTQEHLLDSVPNLTIDHIIKGPEGYAEYALEYPLKDRMVCSDYSRRKVKFKNKDGKVITDPEMTVLAVKFFESIKEKNKELICKYANVLKEKLGDDNVMDTVVKLFDYKADVERGSEGGEKTDFHHDFVRQLCSQTIKE
jgi:hypothetical protein